jgi:hypothetical protein
MARESFGKGNPRGKRATLVVQNKTLQSSHDSLPLVAAVACLNLYWSEWSRKIAKSQENWKSGLSQSGSLSFDDARYRDFEV